MEHHFQRLWTLAEAQEVLPDVETHLRRLQDLYKQYTANRSQINTITPAARLNGQRKVYDSITHNIESLQSQMNELLDRFNAWGIEIKDLDTGLIDFPHERDGRIVYLCWKIGEDSIQYWHDLDTGFAGRQPL